MIQAIVNISGKQYQVYEGQEVVVDRLKSNLEGEKKLIFNSVLAILDSGKTKIGSPTVKGAKVEAEFLMDFRGIKLRVSKYKAKSRYRKTNGFRASKSKIKITKIVL